MDEIKPVYVDKRRTLLSDKSAATNELLFFRALARTLVWSENSGLFHAALAGSTLQQRISRLKVKNFLEADIILKELEQMRPVITYRVLPRGAISTVCPFTDAPFSISKSQAYEQSGILPGISFEVKSDTSPTYHLTDWCSLKQRRVSQSFYGAETLACTVGDDR